MVEAVASEVTPDASPRLHQRLLLDRFALRSGSQPDWPAWLVLCASLIDCLWTNRPQGNAGIPAGHAALNGFWAGEYM